MEYKLSEDSDHHKRLPSLLSFASAKSDHYSRSKCLEASIIDLDDSQNSFSTIYLISSAQRAQ